MGQRSTAIGGAIIHQQQLKIRKALAQHAFHRGMQQHPGIIDRHDNTDQWGLLHTVHLPLGLYFISILMLTFMFQCSVHLAVWQRHAKQALQKRRFPARLGKVPFQLCRGVQIGAPAGWGSQLPAAAVLHGDLTQGAHLLHAGACTICKNAAMQVCGGICTSRSGPACQR